MNEREAVLTFFETSENDNFTDFSDSKEGKKSEGIIFLFPKGRVSSFKLKETKEANLPMTGVSHEIPLNVLLFYL